MNVDALRVSLQACGAGARHRRFDSFESFLASGRGRRYRPSAFSSSEGGLVGGARTAMLSIPIRNGSARPALVEQPVTGTVPP